MRADWERDGIKLYCADCMDVLPHLSGVDLLLTDPPYGIGVDGQAFSTSSHGGRKPYEFLGWDNGRPSTLLLRSFIDLAENSIVWGGNYLVEALTPSMGWLVWDKGQEICSSDCELAFTTYQKALRRIVINRVELQKDGAVHPTQKPVKLMTWCLLYADEAETVLDPFMGSGSSGVACVKLGRKFIGIERERKYFDIAVKRIERALSEERSSLFPVSKEIQRELI